MNHRTLFRCCAFLLLAGTVLVLPGLGQYREYYLLGKVLDTQKRPLEGVEITLRDESTSRSYTMKTNKDGAYKFAGLPHGVYKVVVKKAGYAVKEDEWKFETPQPSMEKVELQPIILASQEVVQEVQRLKEAEAGVKAGAEKIRQGDYDGALASLKPVLDKDPKDPNALYLTGMAYLKKKMYAEAVGPFTLVTELSPRFAAAYYQLGVCFQQQNETDKALEYYGKATALDPDNADSLYNAGLILFTHSRIDEALPLFEKGMALRPDDPVFVEMAGRCYINKADFAKAVEYLEKAKAGYAADPEKVKFLDDLIGKLKEQIKK